MPPKIKLREDAKEKLLDAAVRKFGEADFDSVSIREIAKEAGVNVAGIKYHFGNKEGLLEETIIRKLSSSVDLARRAAAESSDSNRFQHVFETLIERACQMDEGPYLEVNFRTVLDRKGPKARIDFHQKYVAPLNEVLVGAARLCPLKTSWKFLDPEDLVMIMVGLPKFWKLFGELFLSPERSKGLSTAQLQKQGSEVSMQILRGISEEAH